LKKNKSEFELIAQGLFENYEEVFSYFEKLKTSIEN